MQVGGGTASMGYSSASEARQAREALGKALEALQAAGGDVNHSETFWLRDRIAATREALGAG